MLPNTAEAALETTATVAENTLQMLLRQPVTNNCNQKRPLFMTPISSPVEDAKTMDGASPGADGPVWRVSDSALEAVTAIEWESWSGLSPPDSVREENSD
jgi:hypothetical protein